MSRPSTLIDTEKTLRHLFLADYPLTLSMAQVGQICGMSEAWAREKVRRGEIPALPVSGEKRVGKHALLQWLGANELLATLNASSPDRRTTEEGR